MSSIFISYSHKDEALKEKLLSHLSELKAQGLIDPWHDRQIKGGDKFDSAIDKSLNEADIILLLVSSHFLNSKYIRDIELNRAMERDQAGEARVIPVILRHCDWQNAPFGHLNVAPEGGKPIWSWRDRDQACLNVVKMIRAALPKSVPKVPKPEPVQKEPKQGPVSQQPKPGTVATQRLAFRIIPPVGDKFTFPLPSADKISLGRSKDNDLVLPPDDLTVSRHHCYAFILADSVIIEDRNSTNTPVINGIETKSGELKLGQELELGYTKLILEAQ